MAKSKIRRPTSFLFIVEAKLREIASLHSASGWKLDHALLSSKHFASPQSEYLTESAPYIFARKPGAMSDHAVLLVDADLK